MALKTTGKVAAVLALACGLTACADRISANQQTNASTDPSANFPIGAKPKEAVLVLENLSERRVAHDSSLNARVGAFTYDFVNRGSSNMQVLVGASGADDAAAKGVAREAVQMLAKQGVPSSRMDVRMVSGNQNLKPGMVVMRYTQWVAVAPECPGYGVNVGLDYNNLQTPNLGCSIQRNIAAMVADPRDLAQPSQVEPRLGDQGEAVMRKFRRGEETKTFEWVDVQFGN